MPNDVWISAPLRGRPCGAAASLAFSPFYGEVDPAGAVKLAMAEAITKLVASGVNAADIVLCDNFYTPRITPATAWDLERMVDACCRLSRRFGTPFISGKDSSSGTFVGEAVERIEVPPTICVFGLGRMPDVRRRVPKPFQKAGSALLLIGPLSSRLGGSVYLDTLGKRGDGLPDPDESELMRTWKAIEGLREAGCVLSASAVGEGGVVRRLFEMSLGGGLGCRLETAALSGALEAKSPVPALFAEMVGSVLIEVPEKQAEEIRARTGAVAVGAVLEAPVLSMRAGSLELKLQVADLAAAWEKPFREVAL